MLLAEQFVLLALDADGSPAKGYAHHAAAAVAVTGALVTELTLDGHVDLSDGRIRLTGSRPEHPMLARALDNLAPHDGKKLKSRFGTIRHAGWREVVDGMVAAGVIGREKRALLLPTRHPVSDQAAHAQFLAAIRAAAVSDAPMDTGTACLLALAGASQHLEVVAPRRADRAAAKRRINAAAEQVPAAAAVKYVIQAAAAAAAAAAIAAGSS